MFLIEKLYELKKWISEKYKMYFTIEGKYTCILPDKIYLKKVYKARIGKNLNLKNPKTFMEKMNWLKLYDRNPLYTIMADKYKAREYIAEKVGEQYLVPLLGVWDSPDEIDFDALPDQFVLKCNHDNGVIICKDKSQLDVEKIKKELSERLERDYYKKLREWPYKNIPRKIICEKYMKNDNGTKPLDYKFFCFNGEPRLVMVNSNRFSNGGVGVDFYNMDWKYVEINYGHHTSAGDVFIQPKGFFAMQDFAKKLSENIPLIRVDFSYWNEEVYVGELTFFSAGGYTDLSPVEWEKELGSWIELPKKHRR